MEKDNQSSEKISKNSPVYQISTSISDDIGSIELPHGYTTRIATSEDIDDIIQVRKESWKETYSMLDDHYIEQRFTEHHAENTDLLQKLIREGQKIYIAEYHGEMIGIKYPPWYDKDRSMHRIGAIYILRSHHNKGVGTYLMKISLQNHNEDLILGVEKSNINAIRFYKKLGFVEDSALEYDYVLDDDHKIRTVWMKRIHK